MTDSSDSPLISSFLQRHGHAIDHSWFTPDTLVVVFKTQVTSRGVAKFMADLITQTHPVMAQFNDRDNTLTLAFDATD